MSIYEYRCTRCGHQFEVTHTVSDTLERCEKCSGPVRRVFSPVGIIFKGSGFHVTDYRKTSTSAERDGKAADDGKGATPAAAASGSGGSSEKSRSDNPSATPSTGAATKPS